MGRMQLKIKNWTFEKGKKKFEAGIEKLTATFEGLE